MTAPPAGALEACLALLEKATPGEWMLATSCSWRRVITTSGGPVIVPTTQQSDGHPDLNCGIGHVNAELAIAAVNLLKDHGPALLAALRLREGCEGLLARIEREADAHTYFADNADLRMTTGDHAKRATKLTAIRDDLARVLEESATGDEAGSG